MGWSQHFEAVERAHGVLRLALHYGRPPEASELARDAAMFDLSPAQVQAHPVTRDGVTIWELFAAPATCPKG